jgi:hypothetical protein
MLLLFLSESAFVLLSIDWLVSEKVFVKYVLLILVTWIQRNLFQNACSGGTICLKQLAP